VGSSGIRRRSSTSSSRIWQAVTHAVLSKRASSSLKIAISACISVSLSALISCT
jgi:hypothetical protein